MASLEQFLVQDFGKDLEIGRGVRARFPAGHILGAAQISLDVERTLIHFSGDLGRAHGPLMRPPQPLQRADVLVCESTYGDRKHSPVDAETEIGPVIRRVIARGGVVVSWRSGSERVLHHVQAFRPDARNAILLSGYQAGGTRGASLASGARHLRMFGREIPINAEVVQLQGFSGHADADEILAGMGGGVPTPEITYVTHGEPDAADALRARIKRELGWQVRVPEHLQRVDLDSRG